MTANGSGLARAEILKCWQGRSSLNLLAEFDTSEDQHQTHIFPCFSFASRAVKVLFVISVFTKLPLPNEP